MAPAFQPWSHAVNLGDQATHDAGAALDLVCTSSPCETVVRVHNGVSCCSEVPNCCPLLGSDHNFCVAAPNWFTAPHLRWDLVCHHYEIGVPFCARHCLPSLSGAGMSTVCCGRQPHLMKIVVSTQLMRFTNGCSPFSCGTPPRNSACLEVDSPLGGLLPAWLRTSPATVHGETTHAANPLRTVRDSVQLVWPSTVCGPFKVPAGRARFCVDPLPQQPTSGRFCSASRFSGCKLRCRLRSSGLFLPITLFQWRSPSPIGETISPQLVPLQMFRKHEDFFHFIGGVSLKSPLLASPQASLTLNSPTPSFVGHSLIASIRQLDLTVCLVLCSR